MNNYLNLKVILTVIALLAPCQLLADTSQNFLILGVIASSKTKKGVALLKDLKTSRTFAVKEGKAFAKESFLTAVSRRSVEVSIKGKLYKLKVGDDTASYVNSRSSSSSFVSTGNGKGFDKSGDVIKVSSSFKDHLINNDLSKILMQAAAVPHIVGGQLQGFQLWEIEKDSVFEMAGLQNGDLITSINGYQISDVGTTIKQLTSLKNEQEATFAFVRNGAQQKLKIIVQ